MPAAVVADPAGALPAPGHSEPEPAARVDGDGDGGHDDGDFTFVLSPYLWLPVVSGDVGGSEPGAISFEIDTGDLLDAFEFGGLIHGEVRHKSGWGLAVDYMFADLSTGASIGPGELFTTVDANILEVTVQRRVELKRNVLDLYGGFRRWDSDVVVDVDIGMIGFDILTGDTWVDPIAGARYQHQISPKWRLLSTAE